MDSEVCIRGNRRAGQLDTREATTIEQLRAIAPHEIAELNNGDRRCLLSLIVIDLADLYGVNPQAHLLVGDIDLALEATQFHRKLSVMIYIGHIREMKRVKVGVNYLEIGATASLADCYQALVADYPDFGGLLQRFAPLQIRNQGTFGSNIGNVSPIGDAPPLLIALGAKIVLRHGKRHRELPLEGYFLDYRVIAREEGGLIEKIFVPRVRPSQVLKAYKTSKRVDDDISVVRVAISLDLEDGRIARARVVFNSMAAIPKRAAACGMALQGVRLKATSFERAAATLTSDFAPLNSFRTSKEYRLLTTRSLLRRCFLELHTPAVETQVIAYV